MTSIEWVKGADGSDGLSWNALRAVRKDTGRSAHHCEHVNEACRFCYAERGNPRLGGLPFKPGNRQAYTFTIDEEKLLMPLRRKKPTRIFVESMSDAFGEWWPTDFIDKLYAVMALSPQHTYINLSKRPVRRRQYLDNALRHNEIELAAEKIVRGPEWLGGKHMLPRLPLKNVIEGVSVSNQEEADEFVPILLQTRAAVRAVSAEPLLGPIDFTHACLLPQRPGSIRAGIHIDALRGRYCESGVAYTGDWDITGPPPPDSERRSLDWIIVGGESGPHARPMHPDWARGIRDQCKAAGVKFHFKQWGNNGFANRGEPGAFCLDNVGKQFSCDDYDPPLLRSQASAFALMRSMNKHEAGRLLDGRTHDDFPDMERARAA